MYFDIYNIFDEEDVFFGYKFSSVMLFSFIYYVLCYYFLAEDTIEKPDVSKITIMIVFHLLHIISMKVLHTNEYYTYMWLLSLLPIVFYMFYLKYTNHLAKKEELKMKTIYEQLRESKEDGEFVPDRNRAPQQPGRPPMNQQSTPVMVQNGPRMQEPLIGENDRRMENVRQDVNNQYGVENNIIDPLSGLGGQSSMFGGFDPYASDYSQF